MSLSCDTGKTKTLDYLQAVVNWIMGLKDILIIILRNCECVTLYVKWDFVGVITNFGMEGLFRTIQVGPKCNYKCSHKKRQREIWLPKVLKYLICLAGNEEGERGQEASNTRNAAPETDKGEKMDFPLMPLEEVGSSCHLDFSPVKLILSFDLHNFKLIKCVLF